jgi:hypothetical protein
LPRRALALIAFACSAPPVPCPTSEHAPELLRFEAESDGCELGFYAMSAHGCSAPLNSWADDSECRHLASYRCADELTATMSVDPDWQGGWIVYERDGARACRTDVRFRVAR